jgi:hypothetical protein
MFDLIPGLDAMAPMLQMTSGLGALAPALGMAEAQGFGEMASSAWDFGSDALSNLGGALDPSLIGGPMMPQTSQPDAPLPLGLIDNRDLAGGEVSITSYEDQLLY